jgi:hypothetical protein
VILPKNPVLGEDIDGDGNPITHKRWLEQKTQDLEDEEEERETNPIFLNAVFVPGDKIFSGHVDHLNFERAVIKLYSQGFQKQPEGNHRSDSTLYIFKNPATNQKANLSHYFRDKKGRMIDETKISYHQVTRAKRRTPEQKYRDNYVQYD